MANGFLQRFQGKIKCAQLWLGSSSTSSGTAGLYDNASGIRLGVGGGARLAMTVTATTNTDFTMAIPPGAAIQSLIVYTTTAFGAVTDAQITIGTSAGDNTYVAATSIKAGGLHTLAVASTATAAAAMLAAPALSSGVNLWVRIAQSGGNSATGAATLVVDYDLA